MTHAEANLAQIRESAKSADEETLREVVNELCDRVQRAEQLAVRQANELRKAKAHV